MFKKHFILFVIPAIFLVYTSCDEAKKGKDSHDYACHISLEGTFNLRWDQPTRLNLDGIRSLMEEDCEIIGFPLEIKNPFRQKAKISTLMQTSGDVNLLLVLDNKIVDGNNGTERIMIYASKSDLIDNLNEELSIGVKFNLVDSSSLDDVQKRQIILKIRT